MSAKPAVGLRTAMWIALLGLAGCGQVPPPPQPVQRTPPRARETPPPVYPEALACDGIGGQTTLQVEIGAEGRPTGIRIQNGSGQAALDAAAVEAVRGWQFAPATAKGRPVSTRIQVPITFTPPAVRPDRCFALDDERRRAGQG